MLAQTLRRLHAAAPAATAAPACRRCREFDNAAATLEAEVPGLASLGSGYGAVRADDGLCRLHGRHVPAFACCAQFRAHDANAR